MTTFFGIDLKEKIIKIERFVASVGRISQL